MRPGERVHLLLTSITATVNEVRYRDGLIFGYLISFDTPVVLSPFNSLCGAFVHVSEVERLD